MQLPEGIELVGASAISEGDDIFLITDGSTLVRITESEVSTIGRSTKGVRLLRLKPQEYLVSTQVFAVVDGDEEAEGEEK